MSEKKFTDAQKREIDELKRKINLELYELEKKEVEKDTRFFCNEINRPYWEIQEKYGKRLKEIYDSVK